MKDKKKVIALSGAILAIAATIGIGTWIGSSKNENDIVVSETGTSSGNSEEVLPGYKINEDGTIDYYYTNKELLDAQKNMNSFDYIGVQKTETQRVYDENFNTISFEVISDVLSHINLNKKEDLTYNYINRNNVEKATELPEINFIEAFNFDYKKYNNNFDIVTAVLATDGITINMEDNIKDESYYDEYGDIYYRLNNDAGAIEKLLENIEYDEIIESDVSYTIKNDYYNGNPHIGYVGASVVYKMNNKYYEKSCVYTFYIFVYEDSFWNEKYGWQYKFN